MGSADTSIRNLLRVEEEMKMDKQGINKEFLNMSQEDIIKLKFEEMTKPLEFDEEKHKYTVTDEEGTRFVLPSVTEIKAPYDPDFTAIPRDILDRKTSIGVHVHKKAEAEHKEEANTNPFAEIGEIQDKEIAGYSKAMDNYMKDHENNEDGIYLKEVRLFNPLHMYAGTADCIEIVNGKLTIVDYKTVANLDIKRITLQLTGYYLALLAQGVGDIVEMPPEALIVQLKGDGTYKTVKAVITQVEVGAFVGLVQLYNYFK